MMIVPLKWKPNNKVLFIIPPLSRISPNGIGDISTVDIIHPPLGMLYISSICKQKGFQTFIIDQIGDQSKTLDDILDLIKKEEINIVGISCMMSAVYNQAIMYASECKKLGCITVFGGPHVSATIRETASDSSVDIVTYGEGELTWVELLQRLNEKQSIAGVDGIAYIDDNGDVVIEKKRKRIENLDILPFPDYDSIDMSNYIKTSSIGIITSRGCNRNCSFCTSHCTWDSIIRYRSARNIISEIDWIVSKYNYSDKELLFYDDNFTNDRKRVIDLCAHLINRNYKIKWKCMCRVDNVDIELLSLMKKAGCYSIAYGIESGVEKSLLLMNKGICIEDIENAINITVEAGIKVTGYFIIGFPWETKHDFDTTIDFMVNHPQITSAFNFLMPFPGTTFWNDPDKWGITIDADLDYFTNLYPVMETKNYSKQDLIDAMARYLLYLEDHNEN